MINRWLTISLLTLLSITWVLAKDTGRRYEPTDAERARWTYFDMRSIAIAFESYRKDHGSYPQAASLEDLRESLLRYIRVLPTHDAWGNAFGLTSNDGERFQVVSAGSDGRFEKETWTSSGQQADFASDAIVEPGLHFPRSWEFK